MTEPRLLALGLIALFLAGVAVGVTGSWLWVRTLRQKEEELEYQDLPDEPEDMRAQWPLERITPGRYLVRCPEGKYAELAERIVRT